MSEMVRMAESELSKLNVTEVLELAAQALARALCASHETLQGVRPEPEGEDLKKATAVGGLRGRALELHDMADEMDRRAERLRSLLFGVPSPKPLPLGPEPDVRQYKYQDGSGRADHSGGRH